MEFTQDHKSHSYEIIALFVSAFADSEGINEGDLIGQLVTELITTADEQDLFVYCALDQGKTVGCAIFTRMLYSDDERTVFLLSPVAVATEQQNQGVGQTLVRNSLDVLRGKGVDVVLTYGDIAFYGKVGFEQITEETAKAPLALQRPEGWLGQSLNTEILDPFKGTSSCVAPLNRADIW